MTGDGRFVEIQATAEKGAFSAEQYGALVALAAGAMKTLFARQREAIEARAAREGRRRDAQQAASCARSSRCSRALRPRARPVHDRRASRRTAELREDGVTFEENALAKARQAAAATGLPAIADDSGLEVDALDGAPGVYSARYAGPGADDARNNAKLLEALRGVPRRAGAARVPLRRRVRRSGARRSSSARSGACEGEILEAPRGDGGFGYDPLFFVPALGRTMAELPLDEKNRLSHRAAAFRALADALGAPARSAGEDEIEDQRQAADQRPPRLPEPTRSRIRRRRFSSRRSAGCRPTHAAGARPACSSCPRRPTNWTARSPERRAGVAGAGPSRAYISAPDRLPTALRTSFAAPRSGWQWAFAEQRLEEPSGEVPVRSLCRDGRRGGRGRPR